MGVDENTLVRLLALFAVHLRLNEPDS